MLLEELYAQLLQPIGDDAFRSQDRTVTGDSITGDSIKGDSVSLGQQITIWDPFGANFIYRIAGSKSGG